MNLSRDLNITQKPTEHLLHRICESWAGHIDVLRGRVAVDKARGGGLEKNQHEWKKKANLGCGTVDKIAMVGINDHETGKVKARVTEGTDAEMLRPYVNEDIAEGTEVTRMKGLYIGLENHESVKNSESEYVYDTAHTSGLESFW